MAPTKADLAMLEDTEKGYFNADTIFTAWTPLCSLNTRGTLPRRASSQVFISCLTLHWCKC